MSCALVKKNTLGIIWNMVYIRCLLCLLGLPIWTENKAYTLCIPYSKEHLHSKPFSISVTLRTFNQ